MREPYPSRHSQIMLHLDWNGSCHARAARDALRSQQSGAARGNDSAKVGRVFVRALPKSSGKAPKRKDTPRPCPLDPSFSIQRSYTRTSKMQAPVVVMSMFV